MKIPARLKSRKLWITLAALLAQVLLAYSGQIEWDLALKTSVTTVIAYLGAQGYADSK